MSNEKDPMDELRKLHADGFHVGEHHYTFLPVPYKKGRKVMAYLTEVANDIERGKLGFIDSHKFENEIEPILMAYMAVDGFKIDTIPNHFDDNPIDTMPFITNGIQGFAVPFMAAPSTSLASTASDDQPTTFKKPM